MDNILPSLETEVVLEMKAASRAAVVEEASRALARRLAVGPYEREELSVFQKIIKADSELNYDQVRRRAVRCLVTGGNSFGCGARVRDEVSFCGFCACLEVLLMLCRY